MKKMQAQHLPQVADIHKQINPSAWTVEQWQICCEQPYYQNWVVSDETGSTEIVRGFACFICPSEDVELLNIGVSQEFQGRGLGEDLLRACLELVPDGSAYCFLEVRRSNIPAINLYQKLLFEQVSERKDYYRLASGITEDALVFRKKL